MNSLNRRDLRGIFRKMRGKIVCLDAAPIIYYVEKGYPVYKDLLDPFFSMVARGECSVITSVMSVLEALVLPIRKNDIEVLHTFHEFFYHSPLKTIAFNEQIAEEAARLRAFNNIKTPDAIQVATAISAGASAFLANDVQLASIPDIQILVLRDLKKDS